MNAQEDSESPDKTADAQADLGIRGPLMHRNYIITSDAQLKWDLIRLVDFPSF